MGHNRRREEGKGGEGDDTRPRSSPYPLPTGPPLCGGWTRSCWNGKLTGTRSKWPHRRASLARLGRHWGTAGGQSGCQCSIFVPTEKSFEGPPSSATTNSAQEKTSARVQKGLAWDCPTTHAGMSCPGPGQDMHVPLSFTAKPTGDEQLQRGGGGLPGGIVPHLPHPPGCSPTRVPPPPAAAVGWRAHQAPTGAVHEARDEALPPRQHPHLGLAAAAFVRCPPKRRGG